MRFLPDYRADGAASVIVDSPAVGRRLRLKPQGAAPGCFDGGWWPRSRDPVTEFSALTIALGVHWGTADRIGFNLAAWDLAPRQLALGTGLVGLAGFFGLDRHTIVVVGPRSARLTLLVIPVLADPVAAERALEAVTAADESGNAIQILAASGVSR